MQGFKVIVEVDADAHALLLDGNLPGLSDRHELLRLVLLLRVPERGPTGRVPLR